jgi:hypothetical protein
MLSRRTVITGVFAASAGLRSFAQAQSPPAGGPGDEIVFGGESCPQHVELQSAHDADDPVAA